MVAPVITYSSRHHVVLTLGGDLVCYVIDKIKMGKVFTAGAIKGASQHLKRDIPKEGSKIREMYDLFYSNRGKIIDITIDSGGYNRKSYLENSYGLDIRRISKEKWILVGEWDGKVYIDYVVNKDIGL